MKPKMYHTTLIFFLTVHTFLLFPGIVILYKIINSRISPYSPKNKIFYFWDDILIMILSYFVIYLMIRFAFYFPWSKKKRTLVIVGYLVVFLFVYLNRNFVYNFNAWFENTFTTQMKVYWGPFGDSWSKPEPDKMKQVGLLKIGVYYPEHYVRLNRIFSDIDTDDWVLTTIGMFNTNSHWESHPVFLFCRDKNIERLEKFKREKLNYLIKREIENGTIEEIFNGEDRVNSKFMSYIMSDSTFDESDKLAELYFKIDSLENNAKGNENL